MMPDDIIAKRGSSASLAESIESHAKQGHVPLAIVYMEPNDDGTATLHIDLPADAGYLASDIADHFMAIARAVAN